MPGTWRAARRSSPLKTGDNLTLEMATAERRDGDCPATANKVLRGATLGIAALLASVGVAGFLTGSLSIELGPIRISASRPTRVFYQAAVLWVLAESIGHLRKRHVLAVVPIVALFVAGIADSTPRRIGDGGSTWRWPST